MKPNLKPEVSKKMSPNPKSLICALTLACALPALATPTFATPATSGSTSPNGPARFGTETGNSGDPATPLAYEGRRQLPAANVTKRLMHHISAEASIEFPAGHTDRFDKTMHMSDSIIATKQRLREEIQKFYRLSPAERSAFLERLIRSDSKDSALHGGDSMLAIFTTGLPSAHDALTQPNFASRDFKAVLAPLKVRFEVSVDTDFAKRCPPGTCNESDLAPIPNRGIDMQLNCSINQQPIRVETGRITIYGRTRRPLVVEADIGAAAAEATRVAFGERKSGDEAISTYVSCSLVPAEGLDADTFAATFDRPEKPGYSDYSFAATRWVTFVDRMPDQLVSTYRPALKSDYGKRLVFGDAKMLSVGPDYNNYRSAVFRDKRDVIDYVAWLIAETARLVR